MDGRPHRKDQVRHLVVMETPAATDASHPGPDPGRYLYLVGTWSDTYFHHPRVMRIARPKGR